MSQLARHTDVLSPNALIESANPQMGMSGRTAIGIQATNNSDLRFILEHTDGLTKIDSQIGMEFRAGSYTEFPRDSTAFKFHADKGDFDITAQDGSVKISARSIVLDAKQISIEGSEFIRIGYEDPNKTKEIKIIAQSVDIRSKKGSLADSLMNSSFLKTFNPTMVSDLAMIYSGASPAAFAAGLTGGQSNVLNLNFG